MTDAVTGSEAVAVQAREEAKTVWRTGPLESSEQAADLSLNISNTSPDATTYVNEDIEAGWAYPRDAGVECTVTVSKFKWLVVLHDAETLHKPGVGRSCESL